MFSGIENAVTATQSRKHGQDSVPKWLELYLIIGIIALPMHRITLPGNTTIADWINLIFLIPGWIYVLTNSKKIRVPLLVTVWFMLIGTLTGLLSATSIQVVMLSLFKEIYLYIWFLFLINLLDDSNLVRRLLVVWVIVALLEAILLITQFAIPELLTLMTASFYRWGVQGYARPLGTFRNPNLAANYMITSVFLLMLSPFWSSKVKIPLFAILTTGAFATGSRAALTAFPVGLVFTFVSNLVSQPRNQSSDAYEKRLLRMSMISMVLIVMTPIALHFRRTSYWQKWVNLSILRSHNIGEYDARFTIWQDGIRAFIRHPLGIGPDLFFWNDRTISLHNVFISNLVERGVFGFVGVLSWLFLSLREIGLGFMDRVNLGRSTWPAAVLLGCFVALMVFSLTHDTFHFRNSWFLMSLVFVLNYGGLDDCCQKQMSSESGPGNLGAAQLNR